MPVSGFSPSYLVATTFDLSSSILNLLSIFSCRSEILSCWSASFSAITPRPSACSRFHDSVLYAPIATSVGILYSYFRKIQNKYFHYLPSHFLAVIASVVPLLFKNPTCKLLMVVIFLELSSTTLSNTFKVCSINFIPFWLYFQYFSFNLYNGVSLPFCQSSCIFLFLSVLLSTAPTPTPLHYDPRFRLKFLAVPASYHFPPFLFFHFLYSIEPQICLLL